MRVKRYTPQTILLVTWKDIVADPSWRGEEDRKNFEAVLVRTVGFFLRNRKRELHLASDISSDGGTDVKAIPWGCIEEVREIDGSGSESTTSGGV